MDAVADAKPNSATGMRPNCSVGVSERSEPVGSSAGSMFGDAMVGDGGDVAKDVEGNGEDEVVLEVRPGGEVVRKMLI